MQICQVQYHYICQTCLGHSGYGEFIIDLGRIFVAYLGVGGVYLRSFGSDNQARVNIYGSSCWLIAFVACYVSVCFILSVTMKRNFYFTL